MKLRRQSCKVVLILAALVAVILLRGTANAGDTYRVIYKFQGSSDGCEPVSLPAVG